MPQNDKRRGHGDRPALASLDLARNLHKAHRAGKLMDQFGSQLPELDSTVGRHADNDPADVAKTQSMLAAAGFGSLEDITEPTARNHRRHLEQPLRQFQRRAGLREDGRLNPGGPTHQALASNLGRRVRGNTETLRPVDQTRSTILKSDDESFKEFRENLKPREGGYVDDKSDKGGPTYQGFSSKFLKQLKRDKAYQHLPDDVRDITDTQRDQIFRTEFYDKPKIRKLADVPGLKQADPRFAEHIFDAGFQHGPARAGKWLQRALDEELGTDLRTKAEDGVRDYDGNIGPKTRAAVERAVAEGKISAVSDKIVDFRRKLHIDGAEADKRNKVPFEKSREKNLKGQLNRTESFRQE